MRGKLGEMALLFFFLPSRSFWGSGFSGVHHRNSGPLCAVLRGKVGEWGDEWRVEDLGRGSGEGGV